MEMGARVRGRGGLTENRRQDERVAESQSDRVAEWQSHRVAEGQSVRGTEWQSFRVEGWQIGGDSVQCRAPDGERSVAGR